MKKIFFIVALSATTFLYNSFAQVITNNAQPSALLTLYYQVKDALVNGKADLAASKAAEFSKTATALDDKTLPQDNRSALLKSAGDISATNDIKKQRQYFAGFSEQMFALAQNVALSSRPIYKAYCPMKKAAWLSSEAAIRNPYYGSVMLTCGKVVETIK